MERQPVSARTTQRVMDMLAASPAPLTIPEMVKLTGKTYPTVKKALLQGGATDLGGYPHQWSVGSVRAVLPHVAAETIVVPSYTDPVTLPIRWNENRERISQQLAILHIVPEADPKALQSQFEVAASIFATLTHRLSLVKNYPDWYEQLTMNGADDGQAQEPGSEPQPAGGSDLPGDDGSVARAELPTEAPSADL